MLPTPLSALKDMLPDWAKDAKLNFEATLLRSSLPAEDAYGVALAAAYAAKSPALAQALGEQLSPTDRDAALSAASLMAMNNAFYPFIDMTQDTEIRALPTALRMQAYASHGGVDKRRFELFALSASIIGKCGHCVKSHYDILRTDGMSREQLRDCGRIAASVQAFASALAFQTHSAP